MHRIGQIGVFGNGALAFAGEPELIGGACQARFVAKRTALGRRKGSDLRNAKEQDKGAPNVHHHQHLLGQLYLYRNDTILYYN
jgi:hypothetical protein